MKTKNELTHLNSKGEAHMVDVGEKEITHRIAKAKSKVIMKPSTIEMIYDNKFKKGDVISVARIAGIQASKKCSELIPLCHLLLINSVEIEITPDFEKSEINILSTVKVSGKTGVEMEALVSASITALTIYDMCKAVDRHMIVSDTQVIHKEGGKSGTWSI